MRLVWLVRIEEFENTDDENVWRVSHISYSRFDFSIWREFGHTLKFTTCREGFEKSASSDWERWEKQYLWLITVHHVDRNTKYSNPKWTYYLYLEQKSEPRTR